MGKLSQQDISLIYANTKNAEAAEQLITLFKQRLESATYKMRQQLINALSHLYSFAGLVSPDGILLEVSSAVFESTNIRQQEIIGKPFIEINWWVNSSEVQSQLRNAIQRATAGETMRVELTIQAHNGEQRIIDFVVAPLFDVDGELLYLVPVANDITEKRRAEVEFEKNRRFTDRIINTIPNIIYIFDIREQRYIYSNDKIGSLLGYSVEEVQALGDQFLPTLMNRDDLARLPEHYAGVMEGEDNQLFKIEYNIQAKDSTWHTIHSRETIFMRDASGQVVQIFGVAEDVTENRQARFALQASERRFRTFFEDAPVGMALGAGKGDNHTVQVNQALAEFLGYSQQSLGSFSVYEMLKKISHPEDLTEEMIYIKEIAENRRDGYQMEKRFLTASGAVVWGELSVFVLRDNDAEILQTISLFIDRTRRKEAETALRYSESLYRTLMQNLPNTAILVFNQNLRYLLVEGNLLDKVGYKKHKMEGFTVKDVLPEESYAVLEPYYRMALNGKDYHYIRETPDGKHYDSHFFPLPSSTGISGGLVVIQDITDWIEAQRQKVSLELEKKRGHILGEFITNASHEFRTPLAIISTSSYMSSRITDADKIKTYMARNQQQVTLISLLIDRMITMTKLNSIRALELLPYPAKLLVDEAIGNHSVRFAAKSLQIKREFVSSDVEIQVDRSRFTEAISEVLINAIQHAPDSSQITCRIDELENAIVIEIMDEGKGISPVQLPYVFDQFYRGDASHTTPGFGLGLAITQRIINLHNGTIEVEQLTENDGTPMIGSLFRICLPLAH